MLLLFSKLIAIVTILHYSYALQESRIRKMKNDCESGERCSDRVGLEYTKCVRMCISEPCYEELYGQDEVSCYVVLDNTVSI